MNILFIHQNFPGQFKYLAPAFAAQPGVNVLAIGLHSAPGLPGIQLIRYKPHRAPRNDGHHYLKTMEQAVLYGQGVSRVLIELKKKGYTPDVVIAHPGWGETLYVKDVFPTAKLIHFCEYYYQTQGADFGFDPEFPPTLDDQARIRTRNALHLLNLEQCDVAVAPTQWQRSVHSLHYQDKIKICHEGIDPDYFTFNPNAQFMLPSGKMLNVGDKVLTYVARNLEPYRGFHIFMRVVEKLFKEGFNGDVVVVGGDDVSYGARPKDAKNWREKMLAEVNVDLTQVHFLGKIPYEKYRDLLHVSKCHVYLTYPFVLSWSFLEAVAAGCDIVASDVACVREFADSADCTLVNFFDVPKIAKTLLQKLNGETVKIKRARPVPRFQDAVSFYVDLVNSL